MKILLGGVPFGNGNIGDEALLNCAVKIFQRNFPEAELTAASAHADFSAESGNIAYCPAFGFDPAYKLRDFKRFARNFDMFVWAGGTGLSDYPQIGASLLEVSQKLGLKTVIWQVGMNRELNPDYFQLHGKKLKFAELLGITRYCEKQLEKRIRERLQSCVSRCDLVFLRDQPSLIELHTSGEFPAAMLGADPVILHEAAPGELLPRDRQDRKTVGICIAEKLSKLKQQQAIDFLGRLQERQHVRLVFIPMSESDRRIMQPIWEKLSGDPDNIITNYTHPAEIQNVVSSCSLLLSGRLHLTIMGLNVPVPGIGIANSSKIANCLSLFGLPVFNNQSSIDFEHLYNECERWLNAPGFAERAGRVRKNMLARLEQSEKHLRELL